MTVKIRGCVTHSFVFSRVLLIRFEGLRCKERELCLKVTLDEVP